MPYDGKVSDYKTNTVADVLRRAKASIDSPEKWCKFTQDDGLGAMCIHGALSVAICGKPWTLVNAPYTDYLRRAIGWPVQPFGVALWNNAPETTHADVMAAFDKAIALAEQE